MSMAFTNGVVSPHEANASHELPGYEDINRSATPRAGTELVEERSLSSSGDSSSLRSSRQDRRPSAYSSLSQAPTGTSGTALSRHPTSANWVAVEKLQAAETVGSRTLPATEKFPAFGENKKYPPQLAGQNEDYIVEFLGKDDLQHPQNWPTSLKIGISAITIYQAVCATFSSSILSTCAEFLEQEFHFGSEVATLGSSLFVLGFAFGPVSWAPISELYGRRLPLLISALGLGLFNIAVAVAKTTAQIMCCRFFGGLFSSAALVVVPAIMADIYDNRWRGMGIAAFGAAMTCGPYIAVPIGGFIAKSYLGWRWCAYIPAFMAFSVAVLDVLFLPETYAPMILIAKAADIRRLTRNWAIHARQEEIEVSVKDLVMKNISRPLNILFTEIIVLLVTIYISFLYGLLYLTITAYSITFGDIHGMSLGVSGLPYFGVIVGVAFALVYYAWDNKGYIKKLEANNNVPVPEWRMPCVMLGGVIYTIGLFWFGWTGWSPHIHWIVPTLAGLPIGFGFLLIFLNCLNYIIDAYLSMSASAIAGNTFMRSICGAVFPLWAAYMFDGIGIQWGMTFLGCLAAVFIPIPFAFYKYGLKLRSKSKFAPTPHAPVPKDEEAGEEKDGEAV